MSQPKEIRGRLKDLAAAESARLEVFNQEQAEARRAGQAILDEFAQYCAESESGVNAIYKRVVAPWLYQNSRDLALVSARRTLNLTTPILARFPESAVRAVKYGVTPQEEEFWYHTVRYNFGQLQVYRTPRDGIRGSAHALYVHSLILDGAELSHALAQAKLDPIVIIQLARQIESGEVSKRILDQLS